MTRCIAYLDTLGNVIHDSAGEPVRCPNDAVSAYTYRSHASGAEQSIDLCILHDWLKNRSPIFIALGGMVAPLQQGDGGPIIVNNDWGIGYSVFPDSMKPRDT